MRGLGQVIHQRLRSGHPLEAQVWPATRGLGQVSHQTQVSHQRLRSGQPPKAWVRSGHPWTVQGLGQVSHQRLVLSHVIYQRLGAGQSSGTRISHQRLRSTIRLRSVQPSEAQVSHQSLRPGQLSCVWVVHVNLMRVNLNLWMVQWSQLPKL